MEIRAKSSVGTASATGAARQAWMRRTSLAVLVLLVVEYGLGMYVNLYVVVPAADHGASLGGVITEGPAMISVHATVGLLLGLGALSALVHAIRARRWAVTVSSAVGLFAVAFASVAGTAFTTTGDAGGSMAMSVMTGVALLCYAVNLYLLGQQRSIVASRRDGEL
jgi:hypothetical protein